MSIDVIILDKDPLACAQAYNDEDVVQRASEYATTLQLANAAMNGGPSPRHVLAKWAQGQTAFDWLSSLVYYLFEEQDYRFGTIDYQAQDKFFTVWHPHDDSFLDTKEVPRFLQLITPKIQGDPVQAYRNWYASEAWASWTRREPPKWWVLPSQLSIKF